jgi:rare lipoprotein A
VSALLIACLLAVGGGVGAHPIKYFWKYDPALFRAGHTWKDHPDLRARHTSWHQSHPKPKPGKRARWRKRHQAFHHRSIAHIHQKFHYHDVIRKQAGQASWYDLQGKQGACGVKLKGMYAAHKRWKCGSLVSVRAGDRYVHVRIADRGPYVDGRVIDLSKQAFERLAPSSKGVVDVEIYQLEG